ncbi:hypothetical protein C2845_PM08G17000 [Panicum miliaceum]|uniref:F-box domain-containing protein n=1 Tax=Panicum miliaceum TaxID=4540 RepID=A0A3L6R285_PANMI|nr:hypothetical protein C2845_PM08G17000 [Panicum miliaceum]
MTVFNKILLHSMHIKLYDWVMAAPPASNRSLQVLTEGSNDWASLPWLVLEGVAGHLTEPKDFVRVRSVCPKWRDAIRLTAHRLFQPWIMIKEGPGDDRDSGGVLFHSVPALRGKRVVGSGAGLLIGIDHHDDLSAVLVNPLTGESTALPRLADCFQFHGGGHTSGFATDDEIFFLENGTCSCLHAFAKTYAAV